MFGPVTRVIVRPADLSGADRQHVARFVEAYLRQTEREKAEHLTPGSPAGDGLPERYRAEVRAPEEAFADAVVLLAELDGAAAGVAVVRPGGKITEIGRLWADPLLRGQGVGSALLDAALQEASGTVGLTVWCWRTRARALYESRGFFVAPSWDDRPALVCMRRDGGVDLGSRR